MLRFKLCAAQNHLKQHQPVDSPPACCATAEMVLPYFINILVFLKEIFLNAVEKVSLLLSDYVSL